MQIRAKWTHEDLVVEAVRDFALLALPDSALARAGEGEEVTLHYDVAAADPGQPASRAFHVAAYLEMADPAQPDAEVYLTVADGPEGTRVDGVEAVRCDPADGEPLEWSWDERGWVPLRGDTLRLLP